MQRQTQSNNHKVPHFLPFKVKFAQQGQLTHEGSPQREEVCIADSVDSSQSVDHLLQNELSVSDISSVLVLSQPLVKGLACGGMRVYVCACVYRGGEGRK